MMQVQCLSIARIRSSTPGYVLRRDVDPQDSRKARYRPFWTVPFATVQGVEELVRLGATNFETHNNVRFLRFTLPDTKVHAATAWFKRRDNRSTGVLSSVMNDLVKIGVLYSSTTAGDNEAYREVQAQTIVRAGQPAMCYIVDLYDVYPSYDTLRRIERHAYRSGEHLYIASELELQKFILKAGMQGNLHRLCRSLLL